MLYNDKVNKKAVSRVKSPYFPVLVLAVILTAVVWWAWRSALWVRINAKSTARSDSILDITTSVTGRIDSYQQLLRSSSAFIEASRDINFNEWHTFVESVEASKNQLGAQGVGYIDWVSEPKREEFLRNEKLELGEKFAIRPEGVRDFYAPVVYIEPMDEANTRAIGFDMYSEETRKDAMERARETGETSLSKALNIIQDENHPEKKGFLMFTPVYSDLDSSGKPIKSSDSIRGFTYAPFRANVFFDEVLKSVNSKMYSVNVYDVGTNQLLYSGENFDKISKLPKTSRTNFVLKQYGVAWNIDFVFDEQALISSSEQSRPMLIGIIGLTCALLLSGMVYVLIHSRLTELARQKEHEVNSAKDSLLSIASHQLRTPATGVKQYLGIVMQGFTGDVSPSQMQMLGKAYSSNERQLRVINEILHLAKLEAGRVVLAKSPTDVAKLTADIVSEVTPDAVNKNHKIRLLKPTGNPMALVDEHMLRMAIENLLTNAIKYTPNNGKVRVNVAATKKKIEVSVSDNGVGIAADDHEKLFKQFSRIQNKLSREVDGTGIGLFLANQLVRLHGGKISVKSVPGVGSTFTLSVPKGSVRNLTEKAKINVVKSGKSNETSRKKVTQKSRRKKS